MSMQVLVLGENHRFIWGENAERLLIYCEENIPMLSLFFEYPIVIGISTVLAGILASFAGNIDPRLEEMLVSNMLFPLVICGIAVIIGFVLVGGKNLLYKDIEKTDKEP